MKSGFLLLAGVLLAPLHARVDTAWTRTWGGSGSDVAYGVVPTESGGCLVTGLTGSRGAGGLDVLLLELDRSGRVVRELTYGGPADDAGHCIIPVASGGYAVAGYTSSFGAGRKDVYFLRLNQSGETLWTRTYGGSLEDCSYTVRETADSGFVIIGYRDGPGGWTKGDLWVIRTDASGDTLWTRALGGPNQEFGSGVVVEPDQGFTVAGSTGSFGSGGYDIWLLRLDDRGDTLWTRRWGGTRDDVAYDLVPAGADGWLVAGYVDGTPPWTPGDLWLVRVDRTGETLWTRRYGGSGPDLANEIVPEGDGWIIAGSTGAAGAEDVWLVRIGPEGDSLWTLRIGGAATDAAIGLARAGDGGWLAAGYTMSFGSGVPGVYVVKTTADSAGGITEAPAGLILGGRSATIVRSAAVRGDTRKVRLLDACGRNAGTLSSGVYFKVSPAALAGPPRVERLVLLP